MADDPWAAFRAAPPASGDGEDEWSAFRPAQKPTTKPKSAEFTAAETLADVGEHSVRGYNKGLVGLLTAPYEGLRWLMSQPEPFIGKRVIEQDLPAAEDMPLYRPFLKQPEPKTDAGRYAAAAGEAIGASTLPSAALVANAPRMAAVAPTTAMRGVVQQTGETIARAPGAAVAADVIASTGTGIGSEAAKDAGFGPTGQTVGGLIGGFTPAAVTMPFAAARRAYNQSRATSDPHAKVAAALPDDMSVDDLAHSVAVGHSRIDPQNAYAQRTLDILGEEMVRAGGNRPQAQASTLARIVAEDGVTAATARDRLRSVVRTQLDNELMLGEYPAVARANEATRRRSPDVLMRELDTADAMPNREAAARARAASDPGHIEDAGTHWMMDTVANSGDPRASATVRNAISRRVDNLYHQMRQRIQSWAPHGATTEDVEQALQRLRQLGTAAYQRVYNAPGGTAVNYPLLHRTVQRIAERHLNRMAGRSGEQAGALRAALAELETTTADGQRVIMPSLQMLQDMRGAIRGMIDAADRAGRTHIVATLRPLYRDLTRAMEISSPAWRVANRQWADLNLNQVAQELGENISFQAGPRFREQLREFQQLAPEAQDFVRVEVAQKFVDKLANMGDGENLAKLFKSRHMRELVRTMFGDDAAIDMMRLARDQNTAARTKGMMGGSPTQPRQARQKEMNADLEIAGQTEIPTSISGFISALRRYTIGRMEANRNRAVAGILTTPVRDTAGVAEVIARMRDAQNAAARYRIPQQRQPGLGGYAGALNALGDEPAPDEDQRNRLGR